MIYAVLSNFKVVVIHMFFSPNLKPKISEFTKKWFFPSLATNRWRFAKIYFLNWKSGYNRLWIWMVTLYFYIFSKCTAHMKQRKYFIKNGVYGLLQYISPYIPTTSGMPKTEAKKWWLIPKCTVHIGSRKINSMVKQMNIGCSC